MTPVQLLMQSWVQTALLGWPVLVALGLQLVSFRLLRITGRQFAVETANHEAFDFQNRLTAAAIYEQLPEYTQTSKQVYRRFFVIDFFFPLFASIFLSLLWAVLLSRPLPPVFNMLLQANLPFFAFLPVVFDWGENGCFLVLIERYPTVLPRLAQAAVLFKRLKLAALFATIAITLLLLIVTGVMWVATLVTTR